MKKFYQVEDINSDENYLIPKDLILNPNYINLSTSAKIAYSILYDCHLDSVKNDISDDCGIYFLLSDKELAVKLRVSVKSANRYKNELCEFNLIKMERQGFNKENKIYMLNENQI